ncbi:hypothetical protein [Tardiphaga sp.]|jgi:hypothetical protein|uniref:hypothetical protein n=1 Tax=Tardiphaga sp. TaxID=1926292 RepID=UPI0037DA5C26
MSFDQARRDLINFRSENARNPALFHRPSTGASQLEHLQAPVSERHRARLMAGLELTLREIEAIKRGNGKYEPPHRRRRPYRRTR